MNFLIKVMFSSGLEGGWGDFLQIALIASESKPVDNLHRDVRFDSAFSDSFETVPTVWN